MIPLKLTLQGIYSYREKQTIDFDRLTSAGLFGIFGQVGSGKSTILEAISFAVFGHTERLNQKEERYYNMMNLKSNEMLIDFECLAGNKNSEKFRFVVRSKRNGNNFNEVKFSGRDVYKYENNDWLPIEEDPVNIVGLSYENFRRTTIIPQGKFQEFLHLGDSDRTRMLREIFGLHKFELYYQTTAVESKYKDRFQVVAGKLSMLGDLDEEEIENHKKQLENVRAEIENVNNEIKAAQEQEKEFNSLKDVFTKLKSLIAKEQELKSQEEEYTRRKEQLKDYKYCRMNFSAEIEKKNDLSRSINREIGSINSKKEKLESINSALEAGKKDFLEMEEKYNNRESINKNVEELTKISEIANIQAELPELEEKIASYEDRITIAQTKRREFEQKDKDASVKIEELKKSRPDVSKLSEIQSWYNKEENLKNEKSRLEEEFNTTLEKLNEYDEKIESIISGSGLPGSSDSTEAGELLETIVRKKGELRKEIEKLSAEKEHLQVQNQLGEYASDLHEGKPCPLCGSTDHPQVTSIEDVTGKLAEIEKKSGEAQDSITSLEETRNKIDMVSFSKGESRKKLSDLEYSIEANDKNIRLHDAEFIWDEYEKSNSDSVKQKLDEHNRIEEEIISQEERKEAVRTNLANIDEELERLNSEKQKIVDDKTAKVTELNTLKKQINPEVIEEYSSKDAEEIQEKQSSLKKEYDNLIENYNNLKSEIDQQINEVNTLSGELKALEEGISDRKNRLEELTLEIEIKIEDSRFESLEEVDKILTREINIDHEEMDIDDYFTELRSVVKNCEELRSELGDKDYDEEKHNSLVKRMSELDELRGELFQKRGNISQMLDQFSRSLSAKKELEEEQEGLKIKLENIRVIKNMFKGSGFVNYVSTVYLRNLCVAANERFMKLTMNRLSLELNQQNNFVIRDFLNDGQLRSVKTLSGGQTFQAALSLALALSDSIQKTAGAEQNFFFLDEGFGTLDKDSLNMVFDTLKALRKENRVVGVISHVEEMQEEIEASINIVNEPERGSILTMK
ncbi:MAG: nuclease SbcCD subunit C [Melioribacteraceae bacterium]|nr:MAG: nuclease SbcCD subunit C [Melioribacteraceae bacterium]